MSQYCEEMVKEALGKKLGMTQVFDETANLVATTVIKVDPMCVLEKVSYPKGIKAKVGYFKILSSKENKVKKPILGYFKKIGVSPYRVIKEVEIENESDLKLKEEIGVDIFKEGDIVDVRAKSKGKGFQGGMKRHNWHGQPRTHGSTTHRRIGSAGATTFPGRIIKGHRMPGHMGDSYTTIKNLKILKVDAQKGILYIKGAVPGAINSIVIIKKRKSA